MLARTDEKPIFTEKKPIEWFGDDTDPGFEKIAEVRALGVKPAQPHTVGELRAYLSHLDPDTKLELDDGLFPTFIKRPGALTIERWTTDEFVKGHFCC